MDSYNKPAIQSVNGSIVASFDKHMNKHSSGP